jgi:hypothetical protein
MIEQTHDERFDENFKRIDNRPEATLPRDPVEVEDEEDEDEE